MQKKRSSQDLRKSLAFMIHKEREKDRGDLTLTNESSILKVSHIQNRGPITKNNKFNLNIIKIICIYCQIIKNRYGPNHRLIIKVTKYTQIGPIVTRCISAKRVFLNAHAISAHMGSMIQC